MLFCKEEHERSRLTSFSGEAKLAIWKTRKNLIKGMASEGVVSVLNRLLVAWFRVEGLFWVFFFYFWRKIEISVQYVLCSSRQASLMLNFSFFFL